jgi:hypothetical protein
MQLDVNKAFYENIDRSHQARRKYDHTNISNLELKSSSYYEWKKQYDFYLSNIATCLCLNYF